LVERWHLTFDGEIVSTPAIKDNLVAIWTSAGLYLIDGRTGEEKWQYNVAISGLTMPPVILANHVLAPHGEFVDILSLETGHVLVQLKSLVCCRLGAKSMTTDYDHAYIVWGSETLAAYSVATGEMLWKTGTLGTRAPPDVAVCGEDKLCLTIHNFVQVYDATSGVMLKELELGEGDTGIGYPVYDGKATLYVANGSIRGDTLVSLNTQTYHQDWRVPIPKRNYSHALFDSTIYIAGAMPVKVLALDAKTGHRLWEHTIDDIPQTPVEFRRVVYARSSSGRIYALDANDGHDLGGLQTRPFGVFGIIGPDDPYALRPVAMGDEVLVLKLRYNFLTLLLA